MRLLAVHRSHSGGRGMAIQGLREDTRGRERRDRAGKEMLARENRGLIQAVSVRLTRRGCGWSEEVEQAGTRGLSDVGGEAEAGESGGLCWS